MKHLDHYKLFEAQEANADLDEENEEVDIDIDDLIFDIPKENIEDYFLNMIDQDYKVNIERFYVIQHVSTPKAGVFAEGTLSKLSIRTSTDWSQGAWIKNSKYYGREWFLHYFAKGEIIGCYQVEIPLDLNPNSEQWSQDELTQLNYIIYKLNSILKRLPDSKWNLATPRDPREPRIKLQIIIFCKPVDKKTRLKFLQQVLDAEIRENINEAKSKFVREVVLGTFTPLMKKALYRRVKPDEKQEVHYFIFKPVLKSLLTTNKKKINEMFTGTNKIKQYKWITDREFAKKELGSEWPKIMDGPDWKDSELPILRFELNLDRFKSETGREWYINKIISEIK